MKNALNYRTLQLTASGMPNAIVSCKRALAMVGDGRAIIRKSYTDETVIRSSPSFVTTRFGMAKSGNELIVMAIPSVIQCVKSEYEPRKFTNVLKFNRFNIYVRDQGRCQYCGRKVSLSEFTFDHVIPQSEGGITWWTNIVVSCTRCNGQKASKSLKKYHRKLIKKPVPLKIDKAAPEHIVNQLAADMPHETWLDYIYWNIVLEHDTPA
jgi:HNH endonuclease